MNNSVWTTGLIGQRMGSLRYIQNYPLKLENDHWHWWMVMFRAMPIEILTAKLSLLCKKTQTNDCLQQLISPNTFISLLFGSLSIDHDRLL